MSATITAAKTSAELSVPAVVAGYLLGMVSLMSTALWIPAAAADFGVPSFTIGLIASLATAATAVACQGVAPYLVRVPPRRLLAIGAAIMAVAALGVAGLRQTLPVFAALQALQGVGGGICLTLCNFKASQSPNAPRLFGLLQAGQTIGISAVIGICSPFLPRFGHDAVAVAVALIALVTLGLLGLSVGSPMRLAPGAASPPAGSGRAAAPAGFWLATLGVGIMFVVNAGIITTATAYGQARGMSLTAAGQVLGAALLLPLASSGLAVAVAGRVPAMFVQAASGVGCFVSLLVLALGHGIPSFVGGLAGMIFSLTFSVPSVLSGIATMDTNGRSAATMLAVTMVGLAVAPGLSTGLLNATSPAAFAIASAAAIVLGILMAAKGIRARRA